MNAVISSNILRNIKKILIINKITAANFSVLLGGIFTGVFVYISCKEYIISELCDYFLRFATDFSFRSKIEILSGLLVTHFPYMIICTVLGLNVAGKYFIYLSGFVKASGVSLILTHIYYSYKLKGVEYALLVFLPGKIVLIFSMLSLMYISVGFSLKLNRKIKSHNLERINFSEFFGKCLISYTLFIASSLVDFISVSCFSPLFDFC